MGGRHNGYKYSFRVRYTKRIFGAGLDVFENEPEIPSELLLLDNVLLSPHNGTGTIDTRVESTRYALQNIINYFEGKTLLSPVTK